MRLQNLTKIALNICMAFGLSACLPNEARPQSTGTPADIYYADIAQEYGPGYARNLMAYRQSPNHQKPIHPLPGFPSQSNDFMPFDTPGGRNLLWMADSNTIQLRSGDPYPHYACEMAIREFGEIVDPVLETLFRWSIGNNGNGSFTAKAAFYVRDYLSDFSRHSVQDAEARYGGTPRGQDPDRRCIEHLRRAADYAKDWIGFINVEISKGNADLAGTGINRQESIYNR